MIRGKVIQREDLQLDPWVEIFIEDGKGELRSCRVIVDTGFTGWLTLTPDLIQSLGLPKLRNQGAALASGSVEELPYYGGRVLWRGRLIPVGIYQTNHKPLLGMKLLEGSRLTVDAWDGGEVTIQEAAPSP